MPFNVPVASAGSITAPRHAFSEANQWLAWLPPGRIFISIQEGAGARRLPALTTQNFTAGSGLADYTKKLAGTARALLSAGGNLQSTGSGEQIDAVKLEAAIAARTASNAQSAPSALEARVAQVLQAANSALRKSAEGNAGDITPLERSGLEVIVQLVGRPALRYIDGHVQLPPTSLAENQLWEVFVTTKRQQIDALSASVARLNLEQPGGASTHLGTGWRLGKDLLVTNRHVAANMVADVSRTHDEWQLTNHQYVADFAATDQPSAPRVFAIEALAYCASEQYVDAAVLRLKPSAAAFPPPLEPDFDAAAIGSAPASAGGFAGTEVYVVGHPWQPHATDEITSIFGDADGRKRCAPGMTTATRDEGPIFDHDCSTLRGNSGSPVVNRWTHRVVGLHFGGQTSDSAGNLGEANVAVAFSMLAMHRFAAILKAGQV